MSTFMGHCPQCSQEIPKDRFVNGFAFCECGWYDNAASRVSGKKAEKKTIRALTASAFFIFAAFLHLGTWGSHAVEIPFVKLQQLTGTLSPEGYVELANACIGLNRWDCAKTAFTELTTVKRDVRGFAMRAKLEEKLGETQNALATYAQYFSIGGKDATASVAYANLLEKQNRNDEAMKQFEFALANSGETLPVFATTGLVRLLMKQGNYEAAHERILEFHKSAGNAIGYLNTELTQLEDYLSKQAKNQKSKKATKRVATL